MASKTQIANRALFKLGQPRVSNIDTDSSERAVIMAGLWETVRDNLLQTYPWNFAIERTSLAEDAATPAFDWAAQYTLPSDCLQVLNTEDDVDYEVAGNKILSDVESELGIRYIKRVEATGYYPPIFVEAMAIALALEACDKLTDDNTKKQLLLVEMREVMERSYMTDAIENPPVDINDDAWLTARL